MKFGLELGFVKPVRFEPQMIGHIAREADRLGFESLWMSEHLLIPNDHPIHAPDAHERPGRGEEEIAWPAPLVTLAYAAACSSQLKLGTVMMPFALHHPLRLAKDIATLDVLSQGRLLIGSGSGWLKDEFDALEIDFSQRVARSDEAIKAVRALWQGEVGHFSGQFYSFGPLKFFPRPRHPKGVPILVGGNMPWAIESAARLGDGYIPIGAAEIIAPLVTQLKSRCAELGRNPAEIELCCRSQSEPSVDAARRCEDLGVTRIIFHAALSTEPAEITRALENTAHRLIPKFAKK